MHSNHELVGLEVRAFDGFHLALLPKLLYLANLHSIDGKREFWGKSFGKGADQVC